VEQEPFTWVHFRILRVSIAQSLLFF